MTHGKNVYREIGSEFWDVPLSDNSMNIFPENTAWFLSGRAALNAIIRDIGKKVSFRSVALPSWCCDSMILPFVQQGINVSFYPVFYSDGVLRQDFSDISGCDAVLIMDYFGYSRTALPDFSGVVIEDVTHSVFCRNSKNVDYTFGSLRKWAGFYTGGFAFAKDGTVLSGVASTSDEEYITLRSLAMKKKAEYINGNTLSKNYLADFEMAENYLEKSLTGVASKRDIEAAQRLDIDFLRSQRRHNADCLLNELSSFAIFQSLEDTDCPLFVPLLIEKDKRNALRRYLIENNIYCPVHWPKTVWHELEEKTEELYDREISIVCDQRYSVNDMERICSKINEFLR